MMPGKLQDRVAIVTGAGSSGGEGWSNGRAAAVCYAREGARVFATDLSQAALDETARIVRDEGGRCEPFIGDVAAAADVAAMVDRCMATFGQIDILHNNVGIVAMGGPVDMDEDVWDRLMAVNVKSMFLTCKHVLPHMIERRSGVVTNVGSTAALRYTGVDFTGYATTKGAIQSFTRFVAEHHAQFGIRANVIHPGVIDTPINSTTAVAYAALHETSLDQLRRTREAKIPLGRFGTAFDVANAAVFLASDAAGYVTAQELVVDGGLVNRAG